MANILIKNVPDNIIEAFNRLKKQSGKKIDSLKFLSLLLEKYSNDPAATSDNTELITLQNENTHLQIKITGFETETTDLQAQIAALQTELETRTTLTGNQFIYNPDPSLYQKMIRVISYLIKNKKIDRTAKDLPQQLVTKCINYTIKNEYSDIF